MSVNGGVPMINLSLLLEDMVRAIVDNPDEVKVSENVTDDEVILTLNVAESDMGMVIGKHGNIAKALRTITKAAGKLSDRKVSVEIK